MACDRGCSRRGQKGRRQKRLRSGDRICTRSRSPGQSLDFPGHKRERGLEKSSKFDSAHFLSSCPVAATTSTNFGKLWAPANLLILVPLFYLKFLDRIRRLWCRNFK